MFNNYFEWVIFLITINKKVEKTSAYKLNGNLEIVNNDEIYKYKVEVSYKKRDYYKQIQNKATGTI